LPNDEAGFTLRSGNGWVRIALYLTDKKDMLIRSLISNSAINPPSDSSFSTFQSAAKAVEGTPAVSVTW
jgi:hypothetical protein